MSKTISIRGVPDDIYSQLVAIQKKYGYSSLNHFILNQLATISINDGLNVYQNKFAENLSDIKDGQAQILDRAFENDLQQAQILGKLNVIELLLANWLSFIDEVDAQEVKREGDKV